MHVRLVPVSLCALVYAIGVVPATAAQSKPNSLDRIAAYAGTWKTQTEHYDTAFSKARRESSTLHNECWRSSGFYACNQIVDGESKALIVFTYDAKTDTYTTYPIPAGGGSAGSGKLIIQGDTWTFPWEDEDKGKPVHFRVVNVFTAPDLIEYRQEFSRDNVQWTVMAKGTEQK